ncbi:hypothetical protein ACKGJO_09710 [Gracilimonas sp. Q87]|uniref:hypothetical protein n=1 Tax=Gracilimonas sp. Q87 TaxID=3384766 RepID=UPI0039840973
MNMTQKEKLARFIAGIIVFAPFYGIGLYFFSDTGFEWFETLFVAVFWSAGMVIFETLWRKIKPIKNES